MQKRSICPNCRENFLPDNEDVDDFSPAVEDMDEFSAEVEDIDEVEEFTKPTDSIPEKSISVSIEHLRKKMSDDKEN